MKSRYIIALVLLVLGYLLIGGTAPYRKNPEVSEEYKENFAEKDFYGTGEGPDRAKVIIDNGEALKERIRLIDQAQERIVLSTFSFAADTSGKQMLAALKAAADRGVRIQILADGFNSWINMEGNPYFIDLAKHDNVQIKIYNRVNLLLPWKGMSRLHDKCIVADDKVYLVGGRNTFDYFLGDQESYKNYDTDVLVYNTGGTESSVYEVLDYFDSLWELDCCKLWHENNPFDCWQPSVKRAEKELEQIYAAMKEEHPDWFEKVSYESITVPTKKVSLLSGQTRLYAKEPQVFYGLCRLMEEAKENVTIHTPYVILDENMYQSLQEVCAGEAEVFLMTNSAANNGNPFGAVDYLLHKEEILATGLQILEYEGERSYHSKCIAIDNHLSLIGSFNMDMKSAYQDTETMLVVDSEELNRQLRAAMEYYQKSAHPATVAEDEMELLFAPEVPIGRRVQSRIIKVLDPYLRFLL
ncbi:MAG: phospholipase D family protein [Lachnospiraceae bacterium]|nr:phospholipase D family protein [Lachnospiraceae bacterium]